MKTIKLITIILFALLITNKLAAQTNKEEAMLTYQLAQEEFNKSNYTKALQYLDKVEQLNPELKSKSSYLKVKCHEQSLFKVTSTYIDYSNCLNAINIYLENGKDEGKKSELRKIKIKIEDNEDYKLFCSVEKMTLQEAYDYIKNVAFGSEKFKGFEYKGQDEGHWTSKFIDNCTIEFIIMYINGNLKYSNTIKIHKINLAQCKINTFDEIDFTSASKVYTDDYAYGKYEKHFDSDLENFNKGVNKTHTNSKQFLFQNGAHFEMAQFSESESGVTKKDRLQLHKAFELVIKSCQK